MDALDDWYVPNSDDESVDTIVLSKDEILQFILTLEKKGFLPLEWKCPGRRRPVKKPINKAPEATPVSSQAPLAVETEMPKLQINSFSPVSISNTTTKSEDISKISDNANLKDFDFDMSDNASISVQNKGRFGEGGERKPKQKIVANLDKAVSDLIRQDKLDNELANEEQGMREGSPQNNDLTAPPPPNVVAPPSFFNQFPSTVPSVPASSNIFFPTSTCAEGMDSMRFAVSQNQPLLQTQMTSGQQFTSYNPFISTDNSNPPFPLSFSIFPNSLLGTGNIPTLIPQSTQNISRLGAQYTDSLVNRLPISSDLMHLHNPLSNLNDIPSTTN